MANYNKQFNFRNGVQVDDDNLVVTPTGLVGIGTTIPTEILDIDGNTVISGFATASQLRGQTLVVSGKATIGEIELGTSSNIVGSGVSIGAGIITASEPTGIVTFFGDARYLQGMPTSQWIDTDVGLGYTSIFSAGNVGVGTTDPRHSLQIGGNSDVTNFVNGVGIDSTTGNIQTPTGVVTAFKFVGDGSALTSINADQITSGTISNDRIPLLLTSKIPDNIDSAGIITATSFSGTDLTVTSIDVTDISATGIVTALSFVGDITGNVTGDVTGIASTALSLAGTPNIIVGVLTAAAVSASSFIGGITGDVTGNLTGTATTATALTSDAKVDIDDLSAGIATFTTTRINASLGIGTIPSDGNIIVGVTTSNTSADILIDRFAGINTTDNPSASLRLLSDKEESIITIGSSIAIAGNNAQIRYGNRNLGFSYSTPESLDLINYGSGNINTYLQSGTVGLNTGSFYWHDKNDVILTLTYEGRLGIGVTLPEAQLHVLGDAKITGDVTIDGSLTSGSLALPNEITADIIGNVTGNVDGSAGISTFNNLSVTQVIETGQIGVSTDVTGLNRRLAVNSGNNSFIVDASGRIGVRTDLSGTPVEGINAPQASVVCASIGLATDRFNAASSCAVDFGQVGSGFTSFTDVTTREFMRVPRVTAAQIAAFTGLIGGEIVYDTDNNVHKGYNGTTWNNLY